MGRTDRLGWTRQFRHNKAEGSNIGDRGYSMFYFDFNGRSGDLRFPHLFAGVIFGGAVVFLYRVGRRWRMYTRGCPDCGYDLRASPERCPECGRPVNQTAKVEKPNPEESTPNSQ